MILPFSTQLNGKPTYFVEKIWEAILTKGILCNAIEMAQTGTKALHKNYLVGTHKPKLHTIREDKNGRWKPGTKIDFFINCRQKDMFRFAPVLPVVSVQKIEILEMAWGRNEFCYQEKGGELLAIKIDNVFLDKKNFENLAQNDGFDTVDDFFAYFNKDFTGKLIHWTNLKY